MKTIKEGLRFTLTNYNLVYTISKINSVNWVTITWNEGDEMNDTTYPLSTVESFIKDGIWKVQ